MTITKLEWFNWRNQETTKEYLRVMQETINTNTEALTSGMTLGDHTGEMTARLVGRIEAYKDMFNYTPDFIDEEKESEDA